jgi:hypothetical protein
VLQDVKDKAKAFIKRKIEQLSQEHAAVLASCEQQKALLVSACSLAERERDEALAQRDQLCEELRASAATIHSASMPSPTASANDFEARDSEEILQAQFELETLRAQLMNSQRQHAEAVDAAAAADAFRQRQLEALKTQFEVQLQSELSDVQARFSAALAETRAFAENATVVEQNADATREMARILTERNSQLERESRELLQVKLSALTSLSSERNSACFSHIIILG